MLIQGSAGERFGTVIRARRAGEFLLRKSRYAAAVRLPTHHHPQAYFSFVFRGGLRERRESGEFEFDSGSLHFHPALEPHAGAMGPEGATCLSIIPQGAVAERVGVLASAPRSRAPLDRLAGLASRCWGAFHADDAASELSLEAASLELVAAFLRLPDVRGGRLPQWIRDVRGYLHSHYDERIVMRDLARLAGIHEVHLARAFRRHFGATPGTYLRRLRIEAARRALVDSPERLADIALAAGFASQAHFTRVFHCAMGLPPGAYRRRHGRRGA